MNIRETNMNFDAFSHGQIKSKLWLCEKLEPLLPEVANVTILGSWYNVLGFMLLTRNPNRYGYIKGIDHNMESIETSDKICDYWNIEGRVVQNILNDVNKVQYFDSTVVINCSVEHIPDKEWFYKIHPGTLVCLQSSNVVEEKEPWNIKNPNRSLEEFYKKYELSEVLYCNELPIRYENWGYDRYMMIGIK